MRKAALSNFGGPSACVSGLALLEEVDGLAKLLVTGGPKVRCTILSESGPSLAQVVCSRSRNFAPKFSFLTNILVTRHAHLCNMRVCLGDFCFALVSRSKPTKFVSVMLTLSCLKSSSVSVLTLLTQKIGLRIAPGKSYTKSWMRLLCVWTTQNLLACAFIHLKQWVSLPLYNRIVLDQPTTRRLHEWQDCRPTFSQYCL